MRLIDKLRHLFREHDELTSEQCSILIGSTTRETNKRIAELRDNREIHMCADVRTGRRRKRVYTLGAGIDCAEVTYSAAETKPRVPFVSINTDGVPWPVIYQQDILLKTFCRGYLSARHSAEDVL